MHLNTAASGESRPAALGIDFLEKSWPTSKSRGAQ
jgi:hypothetical protein